MSVQNTTFSWEQLLKLAQELTPARRERRPGQLPSTVPIPSSLHKLPPGTQPPVLLYRDTNSWCPFCERVWFALEEKEIPFATEFIELNNQPKWYTDLVPSKQVPAAKIEGDLVYESKDILLALEAQFNALPLLPTEPQEKAIALALIEEAETNGFREVGYKFLIRSPTNEDELATLQASFEAKLDELEQALAKYPGAYFLSTFSLVDIMYASHFERLAASLPVYRSYHIKSNPRFPNLNAWFAALNQRPAYGRVKTDATTFNLLLPQLFGVRAIANPLPLEPGLSEIDRYRAEAAERLSDNHEAAIGDILKNSGVQSLAASGDISAVKDAVEVHLKLLAEYLLHGNRTLSSWGRVDGKENLDPFPATVGAIALTYVRNRICAPRDMSASAAIAFRAAADKVLASLYS
jgi:glutathione S-transferase